MEPSGGRCRRTGIAAWTGGGKPLARLARRPRAGLVTPLPGGLGSPSAPTKRGCLEWLDAARMKGGESCPDRGPTGAPSAPGSYGPGDRKAAMERREAPALPAMERGKTEDWCAAWRSIPSAFAGAEKRPAPAQAGGLRRTRRR